MPDIHPQYITDTAGKNLVVLSQSEFDALIEELEELEDIRHYEETKKKIPANVLPWMMLLK